MFISLPWINRILTDVFTITALLSVAIGTFLGFINRKGEEQGKRWLYLFFLFFFLALIVFFDNTLAGYLDKTPDSFLWRIPATTTSHLGVYNFSLLILSEVLTLSAKQRRPLIISCLILANAPAISFLILKKGMYWYKENLVLPVFILFGAAIIFSIVYMGFFFSKLRKYRDFTVVINYIGIFGIGLFIYFMKISQEIHPQLYHTQNYLFLVLFLLILLFLLSRQSHLEYRELQELRRAGMLLDKKSPVNPESLPFSTTERECTIIQGLCNGLLYKEIAMELDISLSAVKKGVHSVYRKAGVQNRVELIKLLISR